MSEPVLKAILRLFAIVAKDGDVTQQERDHILAFLTDHMGRKSAMENIAYFDSFARSLGTNSDEILRTLCVEINGEVTHKQKAVILLELMSVVLADGVITLKEKEYVRSIGGGLNVAPEEIDLMTRFILGMSRQEFDSDCILLIDKDPSPPARCKHIVRENLQGLIAILHLVQADMFFFKYLGKEDVYMNGVPQKSTNISVLARGSSIRWEGNHMRWEGMEPVYFGEILGQFKKPSSTSRTTFEAKDISYQFKNGKLGLRNISISESSGNLIALMGASGAGKSTLLHVLNGAERPSSGHVLLNSIDIHAHPEKIEGVFGFVPQDDLLMEDLTVYQNLYFAGKLCFDNLGEGELNALVLKTLTDLGLAEIKDLKVGSPLRKTISGGQRKRLNIGLELLREPSILFLDEPTSGLSSRDSENIIELLKELALKGKLVFAVIHQPSSDIFKMFDKLVILDTGGYQIYYGNPVDSITFFKQNINLINSDQGECPECGNVNPEQIFNIIETKVLDDYGNFTSQRKITPEQWNGFYKARQKPAEFTASTEAPVSSLHRPGRLKQMALFGMRDLLSKLGNRQYLTINLLEAPLLALILAFITYYYNTDDGKSVYVFLHNINLPAYLFMSVIVALFMGLTVSAEEIIRDQKILKREAFLHLSRGSYLTSKMVILFGLSAIQTLLFVFIGNTVLQIQGMLLPHWAILFSVSCFANMLGLNISSAFNSAVTIYILIPILLIPQLILSGVVVKFDKLNPLIGNQETVPIVGDFMTSRWGFEAAMVTQFKNNPYEREVYDFDKTVAQSDYKKIYFIPTLLSKLDYAHFNNNRVDSDKEKVAQALRLLQREIDGELELIGREHFPEVALLRPESLDSTLYKKTKTFLQKLRQFYVNEGSKASTAKEKKVQEMKDLYGGQDAFDDFRRANQNEAISGLVKNLDEPMRIIESNGRLVQKVYPIYKDPDPTHFIDFDAQFYLPAKHFLRTSVDTLYFNIGVIWLMSAILYITLYFDVLRWLLRKMENLSVRRK